MTQPFCTKSSVSKSVDGKTTSLWVLFKRWFFGSDYWECPNCKCINGWARWYCGECGELYKEEKVTE